MQGCKPIKVLIPMGVKLYVEWHPKKQEEVYYMALVPYDNVIGSPMYVVFVLVQLLPMQCKY